MTQCLSCRRASPHTQWYHFPPPDEGHVGEREQSLETVD
jgi:hypothetical protein